MKSNENRESVNENGQRVVNVSIVYRSRRRSRSPKWTGRLKPCKQDSTGVQLRIDARQIHRKASAVLTQANNERTATGATSITPALLARAKQAHANGPEHGIWIAPALRATANQVTLNDYLELVDQTGRIIKTGKRGQIPAHLKPILERLQIDVDSWLNVMFSHGKFLGTAVGALINLVTEATRRGIQWIADKTRIHQDRRKRPLPKLEPATS